MTCLLVKLVRKSHKNPGTIASVGFTPTSTSVCHPHQHLQRISNLQKTTNSRKIPFPNTLCKSEYKFSLHIQTKLTVLRLLSPDSSATNPTPHESLSKAGSYRPSGFSGTADNADRTTTRSFGDLPGPSDCQKWSLSDPGDLHGLKRAPKNLLSKARDFFVAEHRVALLPRLLGRTLS